MQRRPDSIPGFLAVLAVTAALVSGCAGAIVKKTGPFSVTGVTRYRNHPLSGGTAIAMRAEPGGREYETDIDKEGAFRFRLPPGRYFIMARSTAPDTVEDLFAFWANNPLQLYGDIQEPLILPFVLSTGPPRPYAGRGIRGLVTSNGRPEEGVVVAAFLDASGEFHGPPYALSPPTDGEGRFILELPPGRYFLLARKKQEGHGYLGPLLKDDMTGFFPDNPVVVRSGEGLEVEIPVLRVNRPRGSGSLAPGESMIVQGRVTTETGRPASGVRVVLYDGPEMLGRPSFISSPTDAGGYYRLEVSRTGRFYAAARSVIGRPPETGELMGFYGGSDDHSLIIEWGQRLKGIDIIVREKW